MRRKELLFSILGLIVILMSYLVPFTLLSNTRDLTLYGFWLSLIILSFLMSLVYLEGDRGE